ncbi:DUF2867 domain-containing protein [Streptomyces actinomycinicus]|uniref:DUF2867 domain-containing protein n=1 Tax=Streptomyces actinomycinicus TaxID=1695166 RepID=A0A937EJK1_9ACTN|nr:DUF2867 domain-containing protein [Streptomyces actinomycinicus]MBL1083445.1 DUF2867 domain-containing protein [Streptomyces actinomycinicus]
MRLPKTAHTSRPWRIHAIAHDFRLEDVWALPTPGSHGDWPRLVALFSGAGPAQEPFVTSPLARALFAIRWKLGALFGWDKPDAGLGARVPTLRDRLPDDLRQDLSSSRNPRFTTVYETEGEWAAEIANRTMHGVLHLGWVPDGSGGYRGQMAVLVKPNGPFGHLYMAAIKPFRYLGVYDNLLRTIGNRWQATAPAPKP